MFIPLAVAATDVSATDASLALELSTPESIVRRTAVGLGARITSADLRAHRVMGLRRTNIAPDVGAAGTAEDIRLAHTCLTGGAAAPGVVLHPAAIVIAGRAVVGTALTALEDLTDPVSAGTAAADVRAVWICPLPPLGRLDAGQSPSPIRWQRRGATVRTQRTDTILTHLVVTARCHRRILVAAGSDAGVAVRSTGHTGLVGLAFTVTAELGTVTDTGALVEREKRTAISAPAPKGAAKLIDLADAFLTVEIVTAGNISSTHAAIVEAGAAILGAGNAVLHASAESITAGRRAGAVSTTLGLGSFDTDVLPAPPGAPPAATTTAAWMFGTDACFAGRNRATIDPECELTTISLLCVGFGRESGESDNAQQR